VIRRALARYAYPTTILTLITGIVAVGAFLAIVAVPELVGAAAVASPTPAPTAAPTITPGGAMAKSPIGIPMASDADCGACHFTVSGGVGVKEIPQLAHPLKGFTDCTACHNPTGLVKTAPGHSTLHKTDCLVCHQQRPEPSAGASAAPMRPEHMGANGAACTSCHGVDDHAPLPTAMKGREGNCWICHNGPEYQYLFSSPSASPAASPAASYPLKPSPAATAKP
jgi:hypothetical protein